MYLKGRKPDTDVLFAGLLPKCPQQLRPKPKSGNLIWISHMGVKDPDSRAITCCFPLSGSWNQVWGWDLNQGTSVWNVGTPSNLLTTTLNDHPYSSELKRELGQTCMHSQSCASSLLAKGLLGDGERGALIEGLS